MNNASNKNIGVGISLLCDTNSCQIDDMMIFIHGHIQSENIGFLNSGDSFCQLNDNDIVDVCLDFNKKQMAIYVNSVFIAKKKFPSLFTGGFIVPSVCILSAESSLRQFAKTLHPEFLAVIYTCWSHMRTSNIDSFLNTAQSFILDK